MPGYSPLRYRIEIHMARPRKPDPDSPEGPDRPERDRDDDVDEIPETPPTEPEPVPVEEPPDAPDKRGPYVVTHGILVGRLT
jgi:hypothetical protein